MKKYYFIGGPKKEFIQEFFNRLKKIGGPPSGWSIYPHANNDGKALHIVEAESDNEIFKHLKHFIDIYDRSEIVEITKRD